MNSCTTAHLSRTSITVICFFISHSSRTYCLGTIHVYIKFVRHNLKKSHRRHVCNCRPTNNVSYKDSSLLKCYTLSVTEQLSYTMATLFFFFTFYYTLIADTNFVIRKYTKKKQKQRTLKYYLGRTAVGTGRKI